MDNKLFGQKLYGARKLKGMTQEQLALELNYTKQAVSKWESGKGMPSSDVLSKIEEILGPLPKADEKDIKKYSDFGKLSEVKSMEKYDAIFEMLANDIETDTIFSTSV